jgi:DNA-binding NarL/FixJ family response regulator
MTARGERELHDGVAQSLLAIAQTAKGLRDEKPLGAAARRDVERIVELAEAALGPGPGPGWPARRGSAPRLSSQELRVLRLAARGLTNREIGARLYISRHTVKEYLSKAMRKLGVDSRVEAVVEADRRGLLDPRLSRAS